MNLSQAIKANADDRGGIENPEAGTWFPIRLTPNLFSGESLNIGVAYVSRDGQVHAKMASDFKRLKCLYDERVDIEDVGFVSSLVNEALVETSFEALDPSIFGGSISFGSQAHAAGKNVAEILESLFSEAVAFATPKRVIKDRVARSKEATVRARIIESFQNRYTRISSNLRPQYDLFSLPDDPEHKLEIHLRHPGKAAGMISSAMVIDANIAELKILRGMETLRTLRNHVKDEQCGLFIMRHGPDSGMPESAQNHIDDLIDNARWQLSKEEITIWEATQEDRMADEIATWYQQAA